MILPDNKIIDEKKQGEVLSIASSVKQGGKKFYLESYGCAMNFSDSEIVASILIQQGFSTTNIADESDVIFINTCAIRDNAELKIRNRLRQFNALKKQRPSLIIGVLGCMAERIKSKLLEEEKLVDIVVGPDAYRDLPNLIETVETGQKAVNVLLSREETYADISPVRLGSNGISAYISIMRGCDNMCSFCVVPFTRGRERSRDAFSIVNEAMDLVSKGYKEVTLLGQNVDSYKWKNEVNEKTINFSALLEMVAMVSPELRVRFSTSHPKDMGDDVLEVISKYENICKHIHLPVQSGNTELLEKMNRGYSREWYMERIHSIRKIIPNCAITTDIITGFSSETQDQHRDTLSLMEYVKYEFAYMYKYSERPNTLAERKFKDDVPEALKAERLNGIIELQHAHSLERNELNIGKIFKVLVDGESKRSKSDFSGRTSQNSTVIFPRKNYAPGDYVMVKVTSCTSGTLIGQIDE
ncbi:MAG: tRNA (N6-isopentenyl adenosine(37)-C2)-methylthiotransferase MiaB [Bacteroidetes bacterium]|nr:tRNA (N6-isopentenyl adenosine(37)-C2)-methylthiotransferase MiaB [Bacteroidota bacterium]HET6243249.1 tRNA (N6-isopentenyl adenosine(37)-C2)-methylthiotransferase MiaB [Bacteroidia bacterium]